LKCRHTSCKRNGFSDLQDPPEVSEIPLESCRIDSPRQPGIILPFHFQYIAPIIHDDCFTGSASRSLIKENTYEKGACSSGMISKRTGSGMNLGAGVCLMPDSPINSQQDE